MDNNKSRLGKKWTEMSSTLVVIGGIGAGITLFLWIGIFVMLFQQRASVDTRQMAAFRNETYAVPAVFTGQPFSTNAAGAPLVSPASLAIDDLKTLLPGRGMKWGNPMAAEFKGIGEGMPFFPHRASTAHKNLNAAAFDNANVCAACHIEIHKQWSEAVMSKAWDDPIYRALLKRASVATNGAVDNFCVGCHSPVGLTTGRINSDVAQEPVDIAIKGNRVLPGVDCEACHNISALTGLDNGAYVMTPRNNPEGMPQKYGPRSDAVSPFHKTVYSELHTQSEFCSACHNVTHPFSLAAIERTFDEWQESSYSFNNQNCQSCHMPRFQGKPAIMGKEREDVAGHQFTGGNVTLLNHFGLKEAAERSRQMLRKAGKIEIVEMPEKLSPGTVAKIKVKVSNTGAGHKLPTGFPEGREVWIDFKVDSESGQEIFRLGKVVGGRTESGTKNFKVHLGDAKNNEVELDVWTVTHIISDNRILPGGYSIVGYDVPIPRSTKGAITIEATLNYWPFSQDAVDTLLGEGAMQVEVVTMASDSRTVEVAALPPAVVFSDVP
jgi:hypothetical protein